MLKNLSKITFPSDVGMRYNGIKMKIFWIHLSFTYVYSEEKQHLALNSK